MTNWNPLARRRPQTPQDRPGVDLTPEAYSRWIRAYRPDLRWFLGLPEAQQETLAELGDEHRKDTCLAIGWACKDPAAAAAGVAAAAGDKDAEVELVRQLTARVLRDVAAQPAQPAAKGPTGHHGPSPLSHIPKPSPMGPTGRRPGEFTTGNFATEPSA